MNKLVKHILYVAHKYNEKITHLQLHKIAYFTLGYLIRENYEEVAKDLYQEEKFEVWSYGPVLPKTYEKYKKYSSTHIISSGENLVKLEELENVNEIILNLINQNVFDLVDISHTHEFWKINKKMIGKKKKLQYNFDELLKEFSL